MGSFKQRITGSDRPLAKVCGLIRQTDLYHALEAGADLVGFVSHAPSPRHMERAQMIALAGVVRSTEAQAVLVTVDAERGSTESLVQAAELDAVQLCGDEIPSDWHNTSFGLLRRVGVNAANPDACLAEVRAWEGVADAFVLDHPAAAGGSGQTVDLGLAEELARIAPCFLAGGLNAEADVFSGSAAVSFVGFDASSRLEARPGAKDPDSVARFIQAVHRYPSASGSPQ